MAYLRRSSLSHPPCAFVVSAPIRLVGAAAAFRCDGLLRKKQRPGRCPAVTISLILQLLLLGHGRESAAKAELIGVCLLWLGKNVLASAHDAILLDGRK